MAVGGRAAGGTGGGAGGDRRSELSGGGVTDAAGGPPAHLVVESAALLAFAAVDLHVLVIASVYHDGVGIQLLVEEADDQDLRGIVPAVRDVSVQQVKYSIRRLPVFAHDEKKIFEMAVRVATDNNFAHSPIASGWWDRHIENGILNLLLKLRNALPKQFRHVFLMYWAPWSSSNVRYNLANVFECDWPSNMRAFVICWNIHLSSPSFAF